MSGWSPRSLASSAGGARRTRITFGSRKAARWGERLATSSPYRCVAGHHRELHRSGDEATWWKRQGIDPTLPARALWLESHPLLETGEGMGDDAPSCRRRTGEA